MLRTLPLAAAALVALAGQLHADDSGFRYPEAKYGKGELRYLQGVPVLVVAGSPEEIGEQMGVLALRPAAPAVALFETFLAEHGLRSFRPLLARIGEGLLAKFPEDYRRELNAAVKAGGVDRDLLVIGNTFHDVKRLTGCSALLVDPSRSASGKALAGRNLDFTLLKGMHQYSLVIVYRPTGKRPFAVVACPGATVIGCAMSAMNGAGLVFGQNDVNKAADASPAVDLTKIPTAVLARRVLEECGTLAEAEKLVQANKPAGRSIFLACDRQGGSVFEVTPRTVVFRHDAGGICLATNHFQSKELAVPSQCPRAASLARALSVDKLGVSEVAKMMHEVNQKERTAHAIIFEPARLRMHVAFGDGDRPATSFPLRELDLAELLRP
jgi:isopenicillin-N N-acyltransferase-like protein